ncbi:putative multidrug resistance-associated protein lethal(2)03659 [Nymphon striatum]|nr:putative multidrug resistance-associated protein lethal(2)03659 [Nymphon striatum]
MNEDEGFTKKASFFTYTDEDLISEQEEISKKNGETELRIIEDKEDKGQYKLDKIEYATSKLVPLGIYKDFFRSAGNPILILLTSLLLNIIYALTIIGFDYWIKLWTEAEDEKKSFHYQWKRVRVNRREILNRFTKDIGQIDDLIPKGYEEFVQDSIKIITMLLIVCLMNTYVTIVTIPLIILLVFVGIIYHRSYTAMKRAENISLKSDVTLCHSILDKHTYLQFPNKQFTSVERVLEYGKIKSEAYEGSTGEVKPSDNWPQNGSISVYNMSLAYDKKNFVLKDICFSIIGGQKVGIVGRTGAGKTSLLNAIFRLEEPMGRLIIDGIDISKIQLHKLRKKLTVIPQEPVLFKNTIRCNLDPFDDYCDEQIWEALESVEMKPVIRELPLQLETMLTEGSLSLSVGQQQLICLARAILKENRIIILDEATSNVDAVTDKIIQRTIRTKFKDFTVITIAHRIHTIIDADAVIVMDDGKIIEMDSPRNLVQDDKSNFYKMIMETESSAPLLIKHAMGSGFK